MSAADTDPGLTALAIRPDAQELVAASKSLEIDAGQLKISTPYAYEFAGTKLTEVKERSKALDELRRTATRPLDQAKKAIMDWFREPQDRLLRAEAAIKRAMVDYSTEQDRQRRAEQARLEERARHERERLEKRAAAAAAAGKEEKAAELEQQAAVVVAPIAQTAAPKVEGVSFREVWKFEITNPALVPLDYQMPDEQKIGAVVRATKGSVQIAGVRIWSEKQVAARSA